MSSLLRAAPRRNPYEGGEEMSTTATELARAVVTARLHGTPELLDLLEEAVPDSAQAIDVIVAMADLVIGRSMLLAGTVEDVTVDTTRLWAAQALWETGLRI